MCFFKPFFPETVTIIILTMPVHLFSPISKTQYTVALGVAVPCCVELLSRWLFNNLMVQRSKEGYGLKAVILCMWVSWTRGFRDTMLVLRWTIHSGGSVLLVLSHMFSETISTCHLYFFCLLNTIHCKWTLRP